MSKGIKFWDKQAEKFNKSGDKESRKLVERSIPYLTSETKLLDFACGTGQSTNLFAELVDHATGIDYSEQMIRLASENKKDNTSFLTGSLDHKALEMASFDVVVAFNVLHLIDDVTHISTQIFDLLKPGGFFISYSACVPKKNTIMVKMIKLFSKLGLFPSFYPLTSTRLLNQLMKVGFDKERTEIDLGKIENNFIVLKKEV